MSDLHKQVSQQCPEGTPLPSKKWLFQFWPKDVTSRTAYQYTGRLEVKFMIQSRQFRHHHIDAHYSSALFRQNIPTNFVVCVSGCDLFVSSVFNRYLREFAIMFRDHSLLIFVDDKHHLKIGEPGLPVAAVERG